MVSRRRRWTSEVDGSNSNHCQAQIDHAKPAPIHLLVLAERALRLLDRGWLWHVVVVERFELPLVRVLLEVVAGEVAPAEVAALARSSKAHQGSAPLDRSGCVRDRPAADAPS